MDRFSHVCVALAVAAAAVVPTSSIRGQEAAADAWNFPDPVVSINGEKVPASELKLIAESALQGRPVSGLNADARARLVKQSIDGLIADRLIRQASKDIKVDAKRVDEEVGKFAAQLGSIEKLEEHLKEDGKSVAELRKVIEASLRQREWFEPQLEKLVQVSDEEIEAFYKATPDASKTPESVRASHILLLTPPEAGPEVASAKLKEIQELRAKIVAGEPFDLMAKKYSEDPGSKDKGGDLNYFRRGEMVKEFDQVAFTLPTGEVSGPVKTSYGYHLIKVTEHKPEANVSLEDAKPRITAFLKDRKRREAVRQLVDGLRTNAKIEIFVK